MGRQRRRRNTVARLICAACSVSITSVMSTLAVVEMILRETSVPMSVREIVDRAGARLPSKSKTPDTVVARDLAMDIKKNGDGSLFVRTAPGRYALRVLTAGTGSATAQPPTTTSMSALAQRKPATRAPTTTVARTDDAAHGGGSSG